MDIDRYLDDMVERAGSMLWPGFLWFPPTVVLINGAKVLVPVDMYIPPSDSGSYMMDLSRQMATAVAARDEVVCGIGVQCHMRLEGGVLFMCSPNEVSRPGQVLYTAVGLIEGVYRVQANEIKRDENNHAAVGDHLGRWKEINPFLCHFLLCYRFHRRRLESVRN